MPTENALHFARPRNDDTPAWYAISSQETNCTASPSRVIRKWLETRKAWMTLKHGCSSGSMQLVNSFSTAPVPYSKGGSEILCKTTSDTASDSARGSKFGENARRAGCHQPCCQSMSWHSDGRFIIRTTFLRRPLRRKKHTSGGCARKRARISGILSPDVHKSKILPC